MNKVTQDIMNLTGCDLATALEIQQAMGFSGFDFSECTERQFRKEVRLQLEMLNDIRNSANKNTRMGEKSMKRATRDQRNFVFMLIPSEGDAKEFKCAWNDAEQCADYAEKQAHALYPNQRVEIAVIAIMTRECVVNRFVEAL